VRAGHLARCLPGGNVDEWVDYKYQAS
jgi:hypothetical protein